VLAPSATRRPLPRQRQCLARADWRARRSVAVDSGRMTLAAITPSRVPACRRRRCRTIRRP